MESKFKGTKGKASSKGYDPTTITVNDNSIAMVYVQDVNNKDVEQIENTKLIVDAFNTVNECDLLPSKLLKQRNELLEFVKEMASRYPNSPHIINPANELIKLIES